MLLIQLEVLTNPNTCVNFPSVLLCWSALFEHASVEAWNVLDAGVWKSVSVYRVEKVTHEDGNLTPHSTI